MMNRCSLICAVDEVSTSALPRASLIDTVCRQLNIGESELHRIPSAHLPHIVIAPPAVTEWHHATPCTKKATGIEHHKGREQGRNYGSSSQRKNCDRVDEYGRLSVISRIVDSRNVSSIKIHDIFDVTQRTIYGQSPIEDSKEQARPQLLPIRTEALSVLVCRDGHYVPMLKPGLDRARLGCRHVAVCQLFETSIHEYRC
jgi:hypothetical protein